MGKGKRYEGAPKLNFKKVFGVIVAILVIVIVVISMVKLLSEEKKQKNLIGTSYYSVYSNGKFGVIDNNGDYVVSPEYDELIIIPNNTKPVFVCTYDINDETGEYKTKVINEQKKEIVSGYDKVEAIDNFDNYQNIWFEDNVLRVLKDGKYGMIDFSGSELLPCEYENIEALKGVKNNFLVTKEGKVGLVNEKGQFIINVEYSIILTLAEGYNSEYIVVDENGNYGLISTSGKLIIEPQYQSIKYLKSQTMFAVKEGETWKLINENGETILEGYDDIKEATSDGIIIVKSGKYGIVTTANEIKIEPTYDELKYAFSIYYIAKKDGVYGIINSNNEQVIEFAYTNMTYIEQAGFIRADKSDTETEILDNNLAQKAIGIISEINLDKGYIKVYTNNEYKYFNFKLEEKSSSDILTANTLFLSKKDGKYGFVDKSGNIVVDYKYDDAKEQNACGFVAVKKDGVWGSINQVGAEVLSPSVNLDSNIYIDFIGRWHLDDSGLFYTN